MTDLPKVDHKIKDEIQSEHILESTNISDDNINKENSLEIPLNYDHTQENILKNKNNMEDQNNLLEQNIMTDQLQNHKECEEFKPHDNKEKNNIINDDTKNLISDDTKNIISDDTKNIINDDTKNISNDDIKNISNDNNKPYNEDHNIVTINDEKANYILNHFNSRNIEYDKLKEEIPNELLNIKYDSSKKSTISTN
ncbi:hypothetical protein C923_01713 [Plasmodium falciparum UGT5.1]|uniref:Uncharacterized protein n=1 Tax=Plasmodium falciparum UGT5.1 TaxID=1237627 RepID=W7K159_PLAFA|nr:hypothetical protein C923_01713 [Plasmodium falciparum UGT5.1]